MDRKTRERLRDRVFQTRGLVIEVNRDDITELLNYIDELEGEAEPRTASEVADYIDELEAQRV